MAVHTEHCLPRNVAVALMSITAHLFLQLTPRLLDAYQNVSQLSLVDAILRYLQIWQALPDFGISYVVVRLEFQIYDLRIL